jgi:hypothetical protein
MKKIIITVGLILITQLNYAGKGAPDAPTVRTTETDAAQKAKENTITAEHATTEADHFEQKSSPNTPNTPTTSTTGAPKTPEGSAPGIINLNASKESAPAELFTEEPTPTVTTIDHPEQSGGWFTPTKKSSTTITDHGDGTHSITSKEEIKNWWSSTAKVKSTTDIYDTSQIKERIKSATGKEVTGDNITAVKKAIQSGEPKDQIKAKTGQKRYAQDGSSTEITYSTDSDGNTTATKSEYDARGNLTGSRTGFSGKKGDYKPTIKLSTINSAKKSLGLPT